MVKKQVINLLSLLFLFFVGCTEEDDSAEFRPAECDTITQLIEEGVLLKDVQENEGQYRFVFETQTLALPSHAIQSIEKDTEHWKTTLTFPDNSVLEIPTLGTSIESFVAYAQVNPSGFCPLAAEVRLNLPQGGRIQTLVHTKEGHQTPDIEHSTAFSAQKTQFITILGLYADYDNLVEIVYQDKEGNERGRTTLHLKTEALTLNNMPNFKVVKASVDKMEPGLTLVNSSGKNEDDTSRPYMVDADGEIRWILDWRTSKELVHIGAQCGLHRLPNGNYLTGDANHNQLVEVDVLGNLVHQWDLTATGYKYHHEASPFGENRCLVAVTKPGAVHADGMPRILDFIMEFDMANGTVAREWDLAQILDTTRITFSVVPEGYESNTMAQSHNNWCHNNGVTATADGSVLCSCRWQGLVKFSQSGELKWVIAPHNAWKDAYKKYLLTPLDKDGEPITDPEVLNGTKAHPDFDWGWGVHCPVELPNGHIMCFDNGFSRFYNVESSAERYSRAVEYEVDEKNMTIRQVWEYGRERESSCFSTQISGVQYLPKTNNRLFCPGINNRLSNGGYGGHIIEINPETNEVVFELEVEVNTCIHAFHRANRISLYPENE